MHSAIFVASPGASPQSWGLFLTSAGEKTDKAKGVLRLAENVWLLNLQESTAPLGWLVALADANTVPYGILPFEHAPEWLPGGFDPSTIQARKA